MTKEAGTAPGIHNISTHTPLAGRDGTHLGIIYGTLLFLLTRPSRDVTELIANGDNYGLISTHTPLAGRDETHQKPLTPNRKFLLTRPSRDVTDEMSSQPAHMRISTHTPLAGRDDWEKTKNEIY